VRERQQVTTCHCVLVLKDGKKRVCTAETSGPDDPFCEDCSNRHTEPGPAYLHKLAGTTVTTRQPGVLSRGTR